LVVSSDFEKGGTWTGAIEQLERLHFVPVFVRNGAKAGRGNSALIQHGGLPWPNPENASELGVVISKAVESVAAEPKQEALSFAFKEQSAAYSAPSKAASQSNAASEAVEGKSSPADELFRAVGKILQQELSAARTEAEVMDLLGVTKSQAKEWLARLSKAGIVEKVKKTKPVQYRAVTTSDRLL